MITKPIICALLAVNTWWSIRDAAGQDQRDPNSSLAKESKLSTESAIHPPRLEFSRRRELNGTILANRPLSHDDLQLLFRLCDFLLNKQADWSARVDAADDLGYLGHEYAIPALLAVIRDETNPDKVRQHAVIAFSRIPDKQVIDHLITMVDEIYVQTPDGPQRDSGSVGFTAAEQLGLLTGHRLAFSSTDRSAWYNWWRRNRDRVQLNWNEVR